MTDRGSTDWGISARAAALHRASLVWDDHGGFAFSTAAALDGLQRWRASGIDYVSIHVGYDVTPWSVAGGGGSGVREGVQAHGDAVVQGSRDGGGQGARRVGQRAVCY